MSVIFVVWVNRVIGGTALELGWFMTAQAVGGLVGGLFVPISSAASAPPGPRHREHRVWFPRRRPLHSPLMRPEIVIGLAIIALVGITTVAFGASFNAILQTSAEDTYRGRLLGAIFTTMALLRLASTVLAGILGIAHQPDPAARRVPGRVVRRARCCGARAASSGTGRVNEELAPAVPA